MNIFIEFWESGGLIMVPIALISILSWYWMFSLFFRLKFSGQRTFFMDKEISRKMQEGHSAQDIRIWLKSFQGIVPRIAEFVFSGNSSSKQQIMNRFEEAKMGELIIINREFSILNAFVKAAPLLGLLGTVIGMIEIFATLHTGNSTSDFMAAGISKALLTTQMGLIAALPGLFGYQYLLSLRNKLVYAVDLSGMHLNSILCGARK